ncbi:MAG: TIGR04211 family SH3 domain-containing protein [Gammaproteobacteria bacterium]|nr:MAG: TIGR04211 family SH3 domain-containing protein [Gammaproteobacteria bacterium]
MKSAKTHFLILPYFLISVLSFTVQAETQYVSDHLVITVRTGQGAQFQIIKTLESGDHVKVLEVTDTGYTRIETTDGTEGWVRSQYLAEEPVASEKLVRAEARLLKTRTALKKLKENYSSLSKEHKILSQNQATLSTNKKQLDTELARLNKVAKKPILLDRQNRELQQKNVTLEKDLQRLNQENHSLKDRSQREWFIAGALVLFGGMILGLLIPKLRGRKRSNW